MLEDTSIMGNSICKTCYHRVCRLIIPPDYYWEEMGIEIIDEEDDNGDGEEQVIEHNYCNELQIPLDHIVLDCNRYVPTDEDALIKNGSMIGS